ncbi:MAG: flavodoxin-dependent (E)-4-hydroxy-3-methylbut-2-enyl-diphosphate synthase [Calditrichaeota bacterium]|nr:MAG: flavodoxin-dependent (E)-4-hydroxy-3-methylbut-2-enyl-diphosphate synthase [Calditrichota bacterium]
MASKTRQITVGGVRIGGGAPVSVQSMTNTRTEDVKTTCAQINRMIDAGCQIVRIAVPTDKAASAFAEIRKAVSIPLVADIHFRHDLALAAIDAGADKIRINPGNIGGREQVSAIVKRAVAAKIPIRVGVNSGSIEKDILKQEGGPTVQALVASALRNIELCRELGAVDLVLSLKSSDVLKTVFAYRAASQQTDVPLHIGVTEAGTVRSGTIKSSVGLGILLAEGIGDTLRVSLTGDPVEEVYVGFQILRALNLSRRGINFISCPTCSRTLVDLIAVAEQIERRLADVETPLTVAVMGCAVNGPGEAREADIGIACGKGSAVLFKKGEIICRIAENNLVEELEKQVRALAEQMNKKNL